MTSRDLKSWPIISANTDTVLMLALIGLRELPRTETLDTIAAALADSVQPRVKPLLSGLTFDWLTRPVQSETSAFGSVLDLISEKYPPNRK